MLAIPAIDLREGHVVQLVGGEYDHEQVRWDDPLRIARQWTIAGFPRLHVVDLDAATPGQDINWLEDIELLEEEGTPAVFDRYSNSFIKIYFPIPEGRENEIARKVLITHLQQGNSYGIRLKETHTKFPQPELGPWVEGSQTVGTDWKPTVLEGWEPPLH